MDIIFSASDIRGSLGNTLTVERAWTVGKAFAEWLTDEGSVVVVRTESANDSIARGAVEGLLLQGRDVIDAGVGEEQTVIGVIYDQKLVGGIFIDHEAIQNLETITLFDARGATITDSNGLSTIGELVNSGNFLPAATKGSLVPVTKSE